MQRNCTQHCLTSSKKRSCNCTYSNLAPLTLTLLQAMMACGVFGMSAVTALTAQNTLGVHSVHVPPLPFLAQQVDSVLGDLGASAVKTGMLPNSDVVQLVASKVCLCLTTGC